MSNQYFTKDGKYSPKRSEELRQARKAAPQNNPSPSKSPMSNVLRTSEKTWATIQQEYNSFKQSNLSLTDYLIESR